MKGLKDKIVLVTGGAKGLGKAMTTRFLQEGGTVVIADVDAEASAATVEELGTLGPIEAYQIDLRDADAIEAMVDYVAEKYGRIDIAVNNAGVQIHGWATEVRHDALSESAGLLPGGPGGGPLYEKAGRRQHRVHLLRQLPALYHPPLPL